MFNKKKLKKMALMLSMIFVSSIPIASADSLSSMVGMAGLGFMKINQYTTYSYSLEKDMNAMVFCIPTNKAAKKPVAGKTGTYLCRVQKTSNDTKYLFPAGYAMGKLTYDGEAGDSVSTTLDITFIHVQEYKDGKPQTTNGSIPVTITATIAPEKTNTTITTGTASNSYMRSSVEVLESEDNTANQNSLGSETNTGDGSSSSSFCSDGSYFCPEEVGGGTTDTGTTSDPTTDLNTSLQDPNWQGTPDYGNLINDLLDDNDEDSYNSLDPDWLRSNDGDDGDENLDDYFNGLPEYNSDGSGMTTDDSGISDYTGDSGVGNNTGYNVGDLVDLDGDGIPDGVVVDSDGDGIPDGVDTNGDGYPDVPLPYGVTVNTGGNSYSGAGGETDGVSLDYIPDGGNYYGSGSDNESSDGGDLFGDINTYPNLYQDMLNGLDGGMNGEGSELLGDMGDGKGSLSEGLSSLLGVDRTLANNKKGTASDQELCDIAKKFLLANGYTSLDISKGKNYDAGSAYTEPSTAWDMNRITTLLRGRKVTLTSPFEAKQQKKTSLTSTTK